MKGMELKQLDRNQILKFKNLFEEQRRNLVYTQSVMNDSFCLQQDDLLDSTDLTTSELETSMRLRLRNREVLYLKKIDAALQRISQGRFGECLDCGDEIGLKRLEARPTTTQCVTCKEEQEHIESLHIDGHEHKSVGHRIRFG